MAQGTHVCSLHGALLRSEQPILSGSPPLNSTTSLAATSSTHMNLHCEHLPLGQHMSHPTPDFFAYNHWHYSSYANGSFRRHRPGTPFDSFSTHLKSQTLKK